jgi:Carboxypeptidase regulatory-like domain/TonB dependent receptor-like, beta-barrel/TonB-dependent Receptor Plug Domain
MKQRGWLVPFVVVVCLMSAGLAAQQGTGELRGRVVDTQGAAMPGVSVVAKNEATGQFREAVTGADGTFFMSALTPGLYEVTGGLTGFKKYQRGAVRVEVGKTFAIEIPLEVGGIEESVTVTADSPLVDTSSKQIGGTVTSQELNDIPSINRNFTTYLGTLPGVTAFISTDSFGADSIRINGQGTQNVNYTLDGAGNNDTFNGGNGGAQARTPVEAIQEFQLLTSQFDAEFGASSGGVVNAVSKAGTNAFHGTAFFFNANDKMTARDYFAEKQNLPKPETKQVQWGGNIGGPIVRDKVHFFANLERIDQNRGVTINIPARPELNFTDFTHDNVWNWMARVDHQINATNTWAVRWLKESSPQSNQFPGVTTWTKSRAEKETDTDWTVVGTLNSVIANTRVNTLKLSYTKEDVFFGNPGYFDTGDQAALGPSLAFQTHTDGFSTRANRRMDPTYQLDETFAWFLPNKKGDHDLKFGTNLVHSPLHIYDASTLNGTFGFSSTDLDFNAANARTYPDRLTIRVPGVSDFVVKGTFVGVFAQDKWKINNRLTASVGLRWDLEVLPIKEKDNPRFASEDAYPVDKNNFAPRLGATWALDDAGTSVIRGGWGMFYQKTPFTFLTGVVSSGVFSDSFTVSFPANNVDAGPSAGRLPTDPFLVNGPVVNRTLLASMFPPGTQQKNAGVVRFDNPSRKLPHTRQASVGYERQLTGVMAVSVDYIRNDLSDLYLYRDLNPGLRDTTARTATLRRIDPSYTQGLEITNLGWANSDSLQLSVTKRVSHGYQYRLAYTLSRTYGNTAAPGGANEIITTQLGDQLNLEQGEARTSQDRPHVLSAGGSLEVPRSGGLIVSGGLQYQSGTPFTLTDSTTDPDRNGQFQEPLPAGTYSGAATNSDAFTVDNKGGFRGARGPGFFLLNLRAGYRFPLRGGRSLQAHVDVFNVTNHANFNTPTSNTGNVTSADRRDAATFLIFRSVTAPTRTAQFNVKFTF